MARTPARKAPGKDPLRPGRKTASPDGDCPASLIAASMSSPDFPHHGNRLTRCRLAIDATDMDAALQNLDLIGARPGSAGVAPPMTLPGVTRLALPALMIEIAASAAD
jgi:hypothetical protein